MKVFKRIKWSYVVLSAIFLLLGIYLVVNPETSLVMICRILGAAMAVFGVMKIVLYFIREVEGVAIRFDFAVGLFCIILGALMLWRAPALTDILSVMIFRGTHSKSTPCKVYRLAEESTTILVFISIYLHSGGRGCRSFSCCLNHYISF